MPSVSRYAYVINRCTNLYRAEALKDTDLEQNHHRYLFSICRHPGISQEELARRVYVNKSNVTRNLTYLESCGYVERRQSEDDKRVTLVYPTEKAVETLPMLRAISLGWDDLVTEDLTEEELESFKSMLARVAEKASALIDREGLKEE